MEGDHTEPETSGSHNDVIQGSPKRQNLKCKISNLESGLIKLSKGKQRIKAHNFKHHTNKKDIETNINKNNTKSEKYHTIIKTKNQIRRSRKERNLLATKPRINGSFESLTSSSWTSSESSDSEEEPLIESL